MFSDDLNASPVNPLPPLILILALALFGVELVLQAGEHGLIGAPASVGWRVGLIERFGFFDPIFEYMRQTGEYSPHNLVRMVTYPVVHANFHHAMFASVMLLALGKKVSEDFPVYAVAIIMLAATFAGPLAYGLLDDAKFPLIGAFPAVYGLLGAYTWILWLGLDKKGKPRWTAFRLIGFLMLLQLIYFFLIGGQKDWIAFFAGFLTGFGLSFVLGPEAGPRVRRWLESIRG